MRTTVTSLVLLNVSESDFIISLATIAHFHLVLKNPGSLRNMNIIPMFACVHWLAGESRVRIRSCEPFRQESWKGGDVYLFQGGQRKVSSECFHSCGKNKTKSVFWKVIILYIHHSAWNTMLSTIHSCNAYRDGNKSFVMRWLVKNNHHKIWVFFFALSFYWFKNFPCKKMFLYECTNSKLHYLKDTF